MPERATRNGAALLATGLALAASAALGEAPAAVCLLLAQVPMALGLSLLRGTRARAGLLADAGRLLLRWLAAAVAATVLVGGPLRWLLAQPSLGHALLLAGGTGALLIGLWWHWPDLHRLAREGGGRPLRAWRQTPLPRDAWRGLLRVALPMALLLASSLLLAWPGLLAGAARWLLLGGSLVLMPLLHLLIQTAAPPQTLHGLPVVEMAPAAAEASPTHASSVAAMADGAQAAVTPDPEALNRALYAAARNGRVEQALALLEQGADPHALPEPDARDRRSLTILAALLPDLRLLRALIARGVDVNAMQAGMSPLLAATRDSWHGRPEAVMTLLANGADPRQTDAEGNTPLHHAARSVDPGVAALLRDAGAEVDACNHEGISPLGSACLAGNWRLARFLLERGARPEPPGGQPALLCAAAGEDDDPVGVQLLLRHKARVDARDARGRSALHEAAALDHAEICRVLLEAGAEVDARDGQGRTPLLEAVRNGAMHALEVLLAAGASVHAQDAAGANALHLACLSETPRLDLVRDLRDLGVDPHAPDAQGASALDLATAAGRWALVAALDPKRPLPVSLDDAAQIERPPPVLLRECLLAGAPAARLASLAALITPRDLDLLLQDDALILDPQRLDWLLRHGADPETRDGSGDTPAMRLLARGQAGIASIHRLCAYGASPAGAGGLARFLAACLAEPGAGETAAADAETFALELLERGADPFAGSDRGVPPLALAARLGWSRLLQALLARGLDPDASDPRGMAALHHAAMLGRADLVKALILAGADPGRRAADGQTPLGIALSMGRRDLAEWLDWRSWRLPRRPLHPSDLPAAAIVGDLDAVRRLLALGLPVNATDAQGCTALLRAAGGGHLALVEFLLAQGADPALAASTGATPLSAAVSMRHLQIVDRLLQANAGLEQRLPGAVTVLMLAAALGLPDVVARLLQAGADLHAVDAQGQSALHCAAIYGFTARERPRLMALLDTLLLAGADPHAATRAGLTPLLLLLGARAEPGTPANEDVLLGALQRLLDEDVRLDDRDSRGYGPLHLAALHGLQRVARALLDAGANPDLRDNLNRSPRDIALMRGYVDVATELDSTRIPPPGGGVSMARFLRE
ncbi:ankyrin repeat domain-containing protein [Thermomonas alba]|uniref:ankyrin repeat domain-containing protein n=1 Tax=Thermomonas alba TaxID=2888525 RepID=UPI001F04D647|nr:ankyrin repeat domain-containing protein [Thermomonas alba]